ncbi:mitochondrial carrier protein [Skeletonema marinoi]|uniref:Mitochondrial carrier protein n=1 Tax=Skeletonema marinoi TaxID=267567 RepID=A0AAD8XSH6_9STRA|nr:mitochondrial carrier protein [Skeletonema marinoi]
MRIKQQHTRARGSRQWTIVLSTAMLSATVSGFAIPVSRSTRAQQFNAAHDHHHGRCQHHVVLNAKHESVDAPSDDADTQHLSLHTTDDINGQRFLTHAQTFVATITIALALSFSGPLVPDANAGFGPSSGATTSTPPNLIAPKIQDTNDIVNQKKLRQLIGSSLDEKRLQQFSEQLDNLTESLKRLISEDEEEETASTVDGSKTVDKTETKEQKKAELEKARILQQQITDREQLLGTLEKQPYWFNYLAAFIGSVASTLVMHPVDTIKTRLQVKRDDDDEIDFSIVSLYEGLSSNILKEGPPSALYLGVYESVKYSLLPIFGLQYSLLIYLTAGAAGEMIGSIVRAPAEAVKSTIQSGIAPNFMEATSQIFGTEESRKNVIRAWSSSIWRDVPFGAIQLAIFELTKSYILNDPDIDFDSSTLLTEAIIGAFAGGWGGISHKSI